MADSVARSRLFQGLEPEERQAVLAQAGVRQARVRETVERQGEPALVFYLVEAGRLKLTQVTAEGREVIVRFVGPGEPFGGVVALEKSVYPVTAAAIERSTLLFWRRDAIVPLIERFPKIKTNLLQTMAEHMDEALTRVRELATERVAQRIALTLLRLGRQAGRRVDEGLLLDLALSRQELAEMTGTTLYTVSRVLSRWESEGVVQSGRQRILIRSLDRLQALSHDPASGD